MWGKGGEGGVALAEKVLETLEQKESRFRPLYADDLSLTASGQRQNSPVITPSSFTSIRSAAGDFDRPGMVTIAPVSATWNGEISGLCRGRRSPVLSRFAVFEQQTAGFELKKTGILVMI